MRNCTKLGKKVEPFCLHRNLSLAKGQSLEWEVTLGKVILDSNVQLPLKETVVSPLQQMFPAERVDMWALKKGSEQNTLVSTAITNIHQSFTSTRARYCPKNFI